MRLRPGLAVLWRGPDEVQIGTDPRWAVRLTGLRPGEVEALAALPDGAALPSVPAPGAATAAVPAAGPSLPAVPGPGSRSPAVAAGLATEPDAGSLVAALREARLLVDAPVRRSSPSTAPLPSGTPADAAAWSLVLDDGDGAALVRARARRVVGFLGAGRLALTAAGVLASAGVGTVLLDDDAPVTTGDLGVGGFTARDVGSPRAHAAARILRDLAPELRTGGPVGVRPDVVVTVEHGVADAARARMMMAAEVVHLSVVVREADVLVGPLVRPGDSACLRCLDLHRTDVDPGWPVLAAQLASAPRSRRPTEESVLAAVGGALTAGQVLAELDGRTPTVLGACLEVGLPDAVPRLRTWAPHPDCGCAGLPDLLGRDPADRRGAASGGRPSGGR